MARGGLGLRFCIFRLVASVVTADLIRAGGERRKCAALPCRESLRVLGHAFSNAGVTAREVGSVLVVAQHALHDQYSCRSWRACDAPLGLHCCLVRAIRRAWVGAERRPVLVATPDRTHRPFRASRARERGRPTPSLLTTASRITARSKIDAASSS